METNFNERKTVNDLILKSVIISVNDVMNEDSTEDQINLAKERIYVAVYNRKREELDLKDLSYKIDAVNRKIPKIPDQKDLKRSLGKLKSFVMFSENVALLNERKIDILKKLARRF